MGAQWLSGRVLDSRPKGRGFEPHRRHCVVVLEQDTFILAEYWFNPGRPSRITERLLSGRKESNQNKSIYIYAYKCLCQCVGKVYYPNVNCGKFDLLRPIISENDPPFIAPWVTTNLEKNLKPSIML